MARPIPDLDPMAAAELAADDKILIDDTSAGETKTMEVGEFIGLPEKDWTSAAETWSYSSWNSTTKVGVLTVPSDATTKYGVGMRVKITQSTGGTKYGTITALTTTTLTVKFQPGYTLNNESISNPYYTSLATPKGAGYIRPAQLNDTGYIELDITTTGSNGFSYYTSGVKPKLRRIGNMVFVSGALKPNHATNSEDQVMITLPAGCRPYENFTWLNQGSSSSTWNMTVQTGGECVLERYNGTMATSSWLTFSLCFIAADV